MDVRSPQDGLVASLAVSEGTRVAIGDILVRIDPRDALLALQRATSYARKTELVGQNLQPPISSSKRDLILARIDTALQKQHQVDPIRQQVVERIVTGFLPAKSDVPLIAVVQGAIIDEFQARQDLLDFDLKQTALAAIQTAATAHSKLEVDFATRALDKLNLVAPRAGRVHFLLAPGDGVALGDKVAEVQP
jgi:multidrug resistance efflux pump